MARARRPARKTAAPLHVAIVAGEHSGDALGAGLMRELKTAHDGPVSFIGTGGAAMADEGLASLVPTDELALFGFADVLARLPRLLVLVRDTADAIANSPVDMLVIIDSPEFTHAVARRVRKVRPDLPVVNYVPPTVWAWRPGRARRMRRYVDLSLALLPFEEEAHRRLGGPPCVYVGHPLMTHLGDLRGGAGGRAAKEGPGASAPHLVVLPGSRRSEVRRLMAPFGETVARLRGDHPGLRVTIPAVASVRALIDEELKHWTVRPAVVTGEAAKHAAFREASAALAASGTVSLELALARVPMVIAYRVEAFAAWVGRRMIVAPSAVMANLVLGRNVVPEFIQEDCTAGNLVPAVDELLKGGPMRAAQLAAFDEIEQRMRAADGDVASPSARAAREVLRLYAERAYLRSEIGT